MKTLFRIYVMNESWCVNGYNKLKLLCKKWLRTHSSKFLIKTFLYQVVHFKKVECQCRSWRTESKSMGR
jgi:hypothetical protein